MIPFALILILPFMLSNTSVVLTTNVLPLEVLDQSNDPLPIEHGYGWAAFPNSHFQSFKPTLPTLTSVDLRFTNYDTQSHTVEVKIREETPAGTVLGLSPLTVPSNQRYPNGVRLHVTFPSPIHLASGNTYLIEVLWDTNDDSPIYWAANSSDPYPEGMAVEQGGQPVDRTQNNDFNFQTWGYAPAVGGEFVYISNNENYLISTQLGDHSFLLTLALIASMAVFGHRLVKKKSNANSSS